MRSSFCGRHPLQHRQDHVAYTRLRGTLAALASMTESTSENMAHVSAMLDAWSIVDSLHRLRRLVEYFPGSQREE